MASHQKFGCIGTRSSETRDPGLYHKWWDLREVSETIIHMGAMLLFIKQLCRGVHCKGYEKLSSESYEKFSI